MQGPWHVDKLSNLERQQYVGVLNEPLTDNLDHSLLYVTVKSPSIMNKPFDNEDNTDYIKFTVCITSLFTVYYQSFA